MSTPGMPAVAGPDSPGPFVPDRRDWLRLAGGVLFAAGALVLVIRKQNDWGHWAQFAVIAITCAALYAVALFGRRRWPALQGWQSAFLVFAVLLLPTSLLLFVQAVHGNASSQLNIAWIFGLSAAVAALTGIVAGAWWQMLIAGVYVAIAFVVLGTKIIDGKPNTIRWLLVVIALILLVGSVVLGRRRRPLGSDLMTAAGLAGIAAGLVSLAGLSGTGIFSGDSSNGGGGGPHPTQGWNVYLLIVSLLLIGYGVRSFTRGPAYIGALGLTAFIGLTGANLVALRNGGDVHTVAGWPLILLIVGALALVVSFLLRPGMLGAPAPTTEPPNYYTPERLAAPGTAAEAPRYAPPAPPAGGPGGPEGPGSPPPPGAPPPPGGPAV